MSWSDSVETGAVVLAFSSIFTLPFGASVTSVMCMRLIPTARPLWVCNHCGYDRSGLAPDAACPECGLPPRLARERAPRSQSVISYWPAISPLLVLAALVLGSFVVPIVGVCLVVAFSLFCTLLIVFQHIRVSPYLFPREQTVMARVAYFPPLAALLFVFVGALSAIHSSPIVGFIFIPIGAAGGALGLSASVSALITLRRALRRTPLESSLIDHDH